MVGLVLVVAGLETAAVRGTPEGPDALSREAARPETSERAPADERGQRFGPGPEDGFSALARESGVCPSSAPAPWVRAQSGGPRGETMLECLKRIPRRTDTRLPLDQRYDLTTFGGPGDEQPTHCEDAPDADGTWFYAANGQRFPCGTRVRLVNEARTRCVVVQVADLGPHLCVESAGGRPAWDVSPLASRHLYGVRSSGWSEHRQVFGAPVAPGNPLGPCSPTPPAGPGSFIGGACRSDADCALDGGRCLLDREGWPEGHCTSACVDSCPARGGPYPLAACTALPDGSAGCLARCDFTLFATGCRPGYACSAQPGTSGEQVCLPAGRCE